GLVRVRFDGGGQHRLWTMFFDRVANARDEIRQPGAPIELPAFGEGLGVDQRFAGEPCVEARAVGGGHVALHGFAEGGEGGGAVVVVGGRVAHVVHVHAVDGI